MNNSKATLPPGTEISVRLKYTDAGTVEIACDRTRSGEHSSVFTQISPALARYAPTVLESLIFDCGDSANG